MIPKERIEQAAKTANDYMTPGNHRAFNDGFECGVSFAESELQPKPTTSAEVKQNLFNYFDQEHGIQLMDSDFVEIENYMKPESDRKAMEFAEWVELNCSALAGNLWELVKDPNSEVFTASELFAKFEAERSVK